MTGPDFDVLVIGAGPAGALAAYSLARDGYRVGVVDKAAFPRPKPCGGGLTIKTLNRMPYSVAPVLRSAETTAIIGLRTATRLDEARFKASAPVCAFAVREEFDLYNVGKMLEAGAELIHDGSLERIEQDAARVTAVFAGRRLSARYLVGADGANSLVRRLVPVNDFFARGFALEGIVPRASLTAMPAMEFFFGYVEDGYGWLFPKGDHVNIGIYSSGASIAMGKERLRDYGRARLGTDRIEQIAGFPLGFGGQNYRPDTGRVVLVGDAAGLVEPMLGEGLHNAVASGQAAAGAIRRADAAGAGISLSAAYAEALAPIAADLRRSERIRAFFYRNMDGAGFRALRSPLARFALTRGFAAGKTVREITSRPYLAPFFRPSRPPSLAEFLAAE